MTVWGSGAVVAEQPTPDDAVRPADSPVSDEAVQATPARDADDETAEPSDPPARAKGVLHYVGLGLSAALLLAVVLLALVVIVLPRVAGAVPLTVLTSSMEPSLPPGTLIVVRDVDTDELGVGDVITYQIRSGDPTVITHRIIGISQASTGERTFELKGDNNSDPDPDPVLPGQVQGEVWYSVPLVGFANNAMSGDARGWVVPVAAVLLLGYAGYMIASGTASAVRDRRAARRD